MLLHGKKVLPLIIAVLLVSLLASCTRGSKTITPLPENTPLNNVLPAPETVPPTPEAPASPEPVPPEPDAENTPVEDAEPSAVEDDEDIVEEPVEPDAETEPDADTTQKTLTSWHTDSEPGDKVAYITIDDGPSRKITPQILDILAEEGVRATFFVLPHNGVDDLYQRIIDEGHELGNHSYSHVYKKLYDPENIELFKEDALAAREFIFEKFGYKTVLYRFPGGAMGRKAEIIEPRKEYLAEVEYRWFDWDLSTGDADSSGSGKDPSVLTANVLNNIRGRSKIVILMHDTSDKTATVTALPDIIAGLRELGYTFDVLTNY